MLKKFLPLFLATLLGGCAAQTFYINGTSQAQPSEQNSQHFFVSGIGQRKITDAAEVCGGTDKVAAIETQQTFINGFLAFITLGIYTPRDAKIYCK